MGEVLMPLTSKLLPKKKNTVNQVTTMLATSKYVWFPGYNQFLTTSSDDPSL